MTDQPIKRITLQIPFKNEEQAILVTEILNVDKELKGSGIHRNINFEDNSLLVTFEGVEYKKLRVSINAFLKNVLLIVKTFNTFAL
ncbi:unnamed protein product, partial [Brenthis ino]